MIFLDKLSSTNSYQRSLGIMLMAENARWDDAGRLDKDIDLYLSFCDDEKPITVRQCVQSLSKIVPWKKKLCRRVADKLMAIDISQRKETQRKILLMDIINVLVEINKHDKSDQIDIYISNAMIGGILDK